MRRFVAQAKRQGLRIAKAQADKLSRRSGFFVIQASGAELLARAVVLCTGASFRNLGIEGEKRLEGRGVYHGAFDEAGKFRGKTVAVVGGGDTAAHQALLLSRFAKKVYLIHRGANFKAARHLQGRMALRRNIVVLFNSVVSKVQGRGVLKGLEIQDAKDERCGRPELLDIQGLFVLIGKEPNIRPALNCSLVRGVFYAGDNRPGEFRQVGIAAGDGMRAGMECADYLEISK